MIRHAPPRQRNARRWRHRRTKALVIPLVLVGVALAALPALAAKPHSGGCWGTCGGDSGPVGGYFVVAGGQVREFQISERCLGTLPSNPEFNNNLQIPSMKIGRLGKFSFEGNAKRSTGSGVGAVRVILRGDFTTPTKAKISLTIKYEKCGTGELTIVRKG